MERTDSFILSRVDYTSAVLMSMDQITATRRRTFTRWVNQHLKKPKLRVVDLEKDMATGVVLIRLLQTLSTHKKVVEKYVS